LFERHNLDP